MPRSLKALSKGMVIPVALAFVVAVSLASCGTSSGGGSVNKNLVIATLFATSSTDAASQLPAQYAAQLAVQQASLPDGYKLTVQTENYESAAGSGPDTSVAATEASALVANSNVVAIVGPFNSGIAKVTIPIINQATLTMISPANTNPGLTLQNYAAANGITWGTLHPTGLPDSYFRTPGNDVVQGKVDASVASSAPISAKSAFVVDDNSVYGIGLSNFFTSSFEADGGHTVGVRESITAAQVSNLTSLASTIVAANPDIVFFGGVTSGGGAGLKKDLVADGYTKPMVGGDGIAGDPAWVTTAGAAASGNTYGTVAAPDTSQLTSAAAASFKTAYNTFVAGKTDGQLAPYSAMTYDVANIEIQAIKNLINAGKPVTRANVRNEVATINYSGLTGDIHFDANGDNAGQRVFSVYYIAPNTNAWIFKTQVNG
jgi:branched-chain amino acid transport system substrate-binding protein